MGWVDPWIGLGWVGSVVCREFLFLVGWAGSWVWDGIFAKNRCRVHNYIYVVTQTWLGGLIINLPVANFLYAYVPKFMKIGCTRQSYCNNNQAYFFGPRCMSDKNRDRIATSNRPTVPVIPCIYSASRAVKLYRGLSCCQRYYYCSLYSIHAFYSYRS